MQINKLTLKNFKKHKELSLKFTDGVNVISGSNYAGKSTVIQGILVGLFGNTAVPGEAVDVVNDEAKDFSVEVTLNNGLVIKRTTRTSEIRSGKGVIVAGHTAVNKHLETLLGIDKKMFMCVFASRQGEPQQLLDMEGIRLQRFVEECVGMSDFDLIHKIFRDKGKEFRNFEKGISETLPDRQVAEERISKLSEMIESHADMEKTGAILQEEIKSLEQDIATNRETAHEMGKIKNAWDKYNAILGSLNASMPDESDDLYEYTQEGLDGLTDQENKLRTEYALSQQKHREHRANKSKLESLQRDLKDKIEGKVTLQDKLESIDQTWRMQELEKSVEDKQKSYWDAKKEIAALQDVLVNGVCGRCNRPFENFTVEVKEETKAKIACLESVRDSLNSEIKESKLEIEQEASRKERVRKLKSDIENTDKWVTRLKDDISSLSLEDPGTEVNQEEYEESLSALCESIKTHRAKLAIQGKIIDITDSIRKLEKPSTGFDPTEFEAINLLVGSLEQKLQEQQKDYQAGCTVQLMLSNEISAEKEFKSGYLNNLQLAEKHAKSAGQYETITNCMGDSRDDILKGVWNRVFSVASNFISTCTGGDIDKLNLSEKGLRYRENKVTRGKVCASGAQKSLMGLGLKVALAHEVASPFSCMILDEISADMDETISTACLSAIKNYSKQTIVVTHREMDLGDNVIILQTKS